MEFIEISASFQTQNSGRLPNRSVRLLFATTQQPHSMDIHAAQKLLPLAKLIKLPEGILPYNAQCPHKWWSTLKSAVFGSSSDSPLPSLIGAGGGQVCE